MRRASPQAFEWLHNKNTCVRCQPLDTAHRTIVRPTVLRRSRITTQDLDSGHHGSGFPLPPFRQALLERRLAALEAAGLIRKAPGKKKGGAEPEQLDPEGATPFPLSAARQWQWITVVELRPASGGVRDFAISSRSCLYDCASVRRQFVRKT